jgi:hypothetical protein
VATPPNRRRRLSVNKRRRATDLGYADRRDHHTAYQLKIRLIPELTRWLVTSTSKAGCR